MLENYDHIIVIKKSFFESNPNYKDASHGNLLLETTFKTYMGSRFTHIDIFEKNNIIYIGLLLIPSMVNVRCEKGPVYGTEEAIKFNELWGVKSMIMQIDGNMHECVVWPSEGNLLLKIVDFVMKNKLGFDSHGIKGGWHQIHPNPLKFYIRDTIILERKKGETVQILDAYNMLKSNISSSTASEGVKRLPVNVHDIHPIGDWYKNTNIFSEKNISVNGYRIDNQIDQINKVYHVLLNVEANNKWPSDQDAFILMRTLYMKKLQAALFKASKIHSKLLNDGSLDLHIRGFVFRCSLVIDKELTNISRIHNVSTTKEVLRVGKRKRSQKIESAIPLFEVDKHIKEWLFQNRFIPDINNQIRVFSSQYADIYVDTCRLVKRWMSSHYIDLISDSDRRMSDIYLRISEQEPNRLYGHCFTEIAIELIVASLFINPNKKYLSKPGTALSGFLRFLRLMSKFDWSKYPLVINTKDTFGFEEMNELKKPLSTSVRNRQTEWPSMVIRTTDNKHGDHWTCQGPNDETLKSVQTLAGQSYAIMKKLLETDSDPRPLFSVVRSKFDVLFHLNENTLDLVLAYSVSITEKEMKELRKRKTKESKKSNQKPKNKMLKPVEEDKFRSWPKDYDDSPVDAVVSAIRGIVGVNGVCSYDKYGGRFIGVTWLKNDCDKDVILASIGKYTKNFISRCELIDK